MNFIELKDLDCEVICGGEGHGGGGSRTTTTYRRYAYSYQSQYANNATNNTNSFNVNGGSSSGAVLIGYQAGYTESNPIIVVPA